MKNTFGSQDDFSRRSCPRSEFGSCSGTLVPIPGIKSGAWMCESCGLELWEGEGIPKNTQEIKDQLASPENVFYSEISDIRHRGKKKGKRLSGRRRRKKVTNFWRKPLDC
jgi:hypothetical protein